MFTNIANNDTRKYSYIPERAFGTVTEAEAWVNDDFSVNFFDFYIHLATSLMKMALRHAPNLP